MKLIGFSLLYSAGIALLMTGPALAKDVSSAFVPPTRGPGTQEVACIGPGSLTGTVVDATTIITPHFSAYQCLSHYPVSITVQFKDPSAVMKVGDTVTLKGRLISVQDAKRGVQGLVLRNAELVP